MKRTQDTPAGTPRRTEARDALWVESSRPKEAARGLEMLHVQLISAVIDPYSWKWVIGSAHHALHAFLLSALDAREESRATERFELEGGWLRADRVADARRSEAETLPELYARVKKLTALAVLPEVDQHITRIDESQSLLFQSVPPHWELDVRELPDLMRSALRVIEHLGWNPGHIRWEKTHLLDLARVKCLASLKVLDALDRQYQSA